MSVAALVLAAGRASRFGAGEGESKAAALLDGAPLVRRVVEIALASHATPTIVVTGHAADAVEAALAELDMTLIRNADYAQGLASSLRAGLKALPASATGVLVLLADMPLVDQATLDHLIACFKTQPVPPDAVVPVHDGRPGNPVLIGKNLFAAVDALRRDEGARKLLADPKRRVVTCEVDDPGILVDVDTREALAALERDLKPPCG